MAIFNNEIDKFMAIVQKFDLLSLKEQELLRNYFSEIVDHKLYVTLYDKKHDINHIMRTCLYCHLLCNKLKVESEYYDMAMMAAIYHDSGLDRNKKKEEHSANSAVIFDKYNKNKYSTRNLGIIKRIILHHEDDSNELDLIGLLLSGKDEIDKVKEIYYIVKDADAIDRNRLDYSYSKCKPRYLRLEASKGLMELADNILFEFKKQEYNKTNVSNENKFNEYYKLYFNYIKKYLPVRDEVIKSKLNDSAKIESILGERASELYRIPNLLFFGNNNSEKLVKAKKDSGHIVSYDSPVKAFFSVIFASPLEVVVETDEHFTSDGKYQVTYVINELIKGTLDEYLNDNEYTIHVLDGNYFYKPSGTRYLSREWVSRSYRDIYELDSFKLNVKTFLSILESKGLVIYNKWNESKDYPNIIGLLSKNYIEQYDGDKLDSIDKAVDFLIDKYYAEYKDFVGYLRKDLKTIMSSVKDDEKELDSAEVIKIRKKEANNFITATFTKVENNERIFNQEKVDKYIEARKNNKPLKIDKKEITEIANTGVIKLTNIEELKEGELGLKSNLKGYIEVLLLSAFIGILLGGIVAFTYIFMF